MATTETELASTADVPPAAAPAVKVRSKKSDSVLDKVLKLLSSVKFGLVMLGTLLTCCMIGMLVMQVNVEGWQKYHDHLKPAQRMVYGALGFFDIYRSRYFTLLLAITGLNIILASIDRFPAAWQYIRKPKLTASPKFIAAQMFTADGVKHDDPKGAAEQIRKAWRRHGFRARINEENNRVTVFAQRNKWNRLGAYVVHVALLTIFTGGFLTSRYGKGGPMEIRPGKSSNTYTTLDFGLDGQIATKMQLPAGMEIECRDIQQTLISPEGGLDAQNTIDWLSYITVKDGAVSKDMLVHLNNVGDYRGYRFFQSQFQPLGYARQITLRFEPVNGARAQIVTIPRDGSADVEGIGHVDYADFLPDFVLGPQGPTTRSPDYNNPAALLEITMLDGSSRRIYAFYHDDEAQTLATKIAKQMGPAEADKAMLVGGNKVSLKEFEKVSTSHTLTIQYDPGRTPVYIGFTLLIMALSGVFFFSHQRVWAVIEPNGNGSKIYFGGNTNRNRPAFEGRFNSLVKSVTGGSRYE